MYWKDSEVWRARVSTQWSLARHTTDGLRDYGIEPQVWGGEPECQHCWGNEQTAREDSGRSRLEWSTGGDPAAKLATGPVSQGAFCLHCNAWRGSLGLEPTLDLYLDHMVEIFRELRRVLRKDGTCWLNIGDSYNNADKWGGGGANTGKHTRKPDGTIASWEAVRRKWSGNGFKPKDLMLIPSRLAIRLQEDGWWVRSDIAWCKRAPMPESCTDRPTSAWEHVFLLTKSARYFYDAEAVKEEATDGEAFHGNYPGSGNRTQDRDGRASAAVTSKRNLRNFWLLGPEPYPEAHFATFVTEIPRIAIKAGTSERGVCPKCGAGWERIIETKADDRVPYATTGVGNKAKAFRADGYGPQKVLCEDGTGGDLATKQRETIGWRPTCSCDASHRDGIDRGDDKRGRKIRCGESDTVTAGWKPSCECNPLDPVPATVLDPFLGAGTTALVADRLGRHCIGIELNPQYAAMAQRRVSADAEKRHEKPLLLFPDHVPKFVDPVTMT